MNYIQKHTEGFNAGQFVLHREDGTAICQLGCEIVIRLRTLQPVHDRRNMQFMAYTVEIVESAIHDHERVSRNSIATFRVPVDLDGDIGNDARIVMNVFRGRAFGDCHKLGLQEYVIRDDRGYVLTINGLLWDGRILHVRDIAC